MTETTINKRAQHLLKVLIDCYIHDGQPVASKTLAQKTQLGLSPATIRSMMADLEEAGYLIAPHKSAGRVPTAQGYRFFVDSLLRVPNVQELEVKSLRQRLTDGSSNLLETASSMLSGLTRLAGLVTLPKPQAQILRHIEFLPLSDNRVLVILVLNDQQVQNRIIHTDRTYTRDELQQASNYLLHLYTDQDLQSVREQILRAMQQDRQTMNELAQTALQMADTVLTLSAKQSDYILAGQNHLLDLADTSGLDKLRQLFSAFTEKQHILHLLDECISSEGIQIFIGEEAGFDLLKDCSMVTQSYAVDGQTVGVLGVIGPTRMPYSQVISAVDVTAKLLSAALSSKEST